MRSRLPEFSGIRAKRLLSKSPGGIFAGAGLDKNIDDTDDKPNEKAQIDNGAQLRFHH